MITTTDTFGLGAALRARRKHLRLTQGDLALSCGTGLRFIIDLEGGKPTCQLGKTLSVVRALGLNLELTPTSPDGKAGLRS